MSVSKTFDAENLVSDALRLAPGETATVEIVVAGGDTFTGLMAVQMGTTPAGPWVPATDANGDPIADDASIAAGTVTLTVKNHTTKDQHIRVSVTTFTGDDAVVTIDHVAGDTVEVLLRDKNGAPVIVRTDQGLQVVGDLNVEGSVGVGGVTASGDASVLTAEGTISAADIIATEAGKFGHAAGVPMVADPGATKALELIAVIVEFDRAVAAYTDGGNITVNVNGGAALTGLISAANSLGNAADKVAIFRPLTTAAEIVAPNKGINLVSSAAFTNPGTAAGVIRYKAIYRLHTLSLT